MTKMKMFFFSISCFCLIIVTGCQQDKTPDTTIDAEAQLAAMKARFAEFDAKAAELPYQPIEITDDGILVLTDANFMEAVNRDGILVVDFWMDGCVPCEDMVPIVKGLARQYKDKICFGKLHFNSNMIMTEKYQVQSFPTFMIFVDGKPTNMLIGAQPTGKFQMFLDKTLLDYQILLEETSTTFPPNDPGIK